LPQQRGGFESGNGEVKMTGRGMQNGRRVEGETTKEDRKKGWREDKSSVRSL